MSGVVRRADTRGRWPDIADTRARVSVALVLARRLLGARGMTDLSIPFLCSELAALDRAWRDDAELYIVRRAGRELVELCEAVVHAQAFEPRDVRRAAREAFVAAIGLVQIVDGADRKLPTSARVRARAEITRVLDTLAPYVGRADLAVRQVVVDGVEIERALADMRSTMAPCSASRSPPSPSRHRS